MTVAADIAGEAPDTDLLGFLIVDAGRLLRAAFEERITAAGLGLTAGEARALINIAECQGDRQLDIASRMGVEPMTLCSYLDKLEALGLVERKVCATDRRAKRIVLTKASDETIRRIRTELMTILRRATSGMSKDDRQSLEASLRVLNKNLQSFLPASES